LSQRLLVEVKGWVRDAQRCDARVSCHGELHSLVGSRDPTLRFQPAWSYYRATPPAGVSSHGAINACVAHTACHAEASGPAEAARRCGPIGEYGRLLRAIP
jgi:hypothetical protein